jgi:tetratricopeptide (TPR) repeat protein
MREALAIQRKFLTDYPWTSVYASDLAFFLLKREKFEEAESLCREAIELKKSLHLHEEGMKFERERLSIALEHQGKLEEAEAVQRELVESLRQGRAKSALAGSLRRLGDLLLRRQKTSEAETTYAEAREVLRSMTQEAAPARPGR